MPLVVDTIEKQGCGGHEEDRRGDRTVRPSQIADDRRNHMGPRGHHGRALGKMNDIQRDTGQQRAQPRGRLGGEAQTGEIRALAARGEQELMLVRRVRHHQANRDPSDRRAPARKETIDAKRNYLGVERAQVAKDFGVPIVMHDYLTGGFTANTSLSHWCRDNGLLLHIHRAMHAVIDRQKNHGIHFRVLAKALRLSGGDHLHSGTVVGKLEGEREVTLGFVDLMRDDYIQKDRSRGIYFTQDWCGLPGVMPQ